MDCVQCREAVSSRLDDEMLPVATRDLDGHLASCAECSQFAEDIRALNRRVRVRPAETVPDLTESILAAAGHPDSTSDPEPARVEATEREEPSGSKYPMPSPRVLSAAGVAGSAGKDPRLRRVLTAVGAAAALVLVIGGWWAGTRSGSPAEVEIAAGYVTVEPGGEAAQLYLSVSNEGGADAITGATTPAADAAALHATTVEDGYVLMGDSGKIPVPANGSVTFRPGGAHVMLEGLRESVAVGDEIPVTVELADSTPVTVTARVVDQRQLEDLVGVDPAGS